MHSLSEPEGDCSDCSSYEELSSVSDNEIEEEELILFNNHSENENSENRRGSTASNYRSWYLNRRGSKTTSESETLPESSSSKSSLTIINESQKNWWYWTKLAVFVASPFIARQLGIIMVAASEISPSLVRKASDSTVVTNSNFENLSEPPSPLKTFDGFSDTSDEDEIIFILNSGKATKPSLNTNIEDAKLVKLCDPETVEGLLVEEETVSTSTVTTKILVDSDNKGSSAPLFPHMVGIKNHALNCYASSLISCLYNIPSFQVNIFETLQRNLENVEMMNKNKSITAAIALIFHKMRFSRSTVTLDTFFASALKSVVGWEFGDLECVLDFWGRLSGTFTDEISSLFRIELNENHFRKSDNVLIKSNAQKSNMILVAPSKKFKTINEFLENNFIDESAEDFFINPDDQLEYPHILDDPIREKVGIPSTTTLTISRCPEILIFGVKRLTWNVQTNSVEFNFNALEFPETLTVGNEKYSLVGNIEYDQERIHYFARNFDTLNRQWYLHDDQRVEMVSKSSSAIRRMTLGLSHMSCMIFYVKKSSLEEYNHTDQQFKLDIPGEIVSILNSRSIRKRESSAGIVEQSKKQKNSKEPKESKIDKKKESRKPSKHKIKQSIKPVKIAVESTINDDDISSKKKPTVKSSSFTDFRLGSVVFLFSGIERNHVLETFLMAIARNPLAVRKLFDLAKDKPKSDIQHKFALIVLKILTGRTDVDVKELNDELVNQHGIDFSHFQNSWMRFSQLLSEELCPIPDAKFIKYHFDEQQHVYEYSKCERVSIKPYRSLPIPSDLKLDGLAADFIDETDLFGETRRRIILKSTGIILPVPITRNRPISEENRVSFDSETIHLHSGEYMSYGVIGFIPDYDTFFAFFLDNQSGDMIHTYKDGISRPIKLIESVEAQLSIMFRKYSLLIFMSKHDQFKVEMPMLSEVPEVFIDELNSV